MTTPARGADASDAAPQLHRTRAEKFHLLDIAVPLQAYPRRGQSHAAHAYIKKAELHTENDGWCHLRQQDFEDAVGGKDEKVKEIRDFLEKIGWIEVSKGCPVCRYPNAVVVRVNWPTIAIAAAPAKKHRPEMAPDNPETKPTFPGPKPDFPERHNKEFINHDLHELKTHNGAYASDGLWPQRISVEMLRSPRTVERFYRGAVEKGWIEPSPIARAGVHGAALYTLRRKKTSNPGGYFSTLVKRKWWTIPPHTRGGMPDGIERDAQRIVRDLDSGRPAAEVAVIASTHRAKSQRTDRDSFAAAEVTRQADDLRLKYQLPEKQQAGAAGPGLLSDSESGVTDVDPDSVNAANGPVNPTPAR